MDNNQDLQKQKLGYYAANLIEDNTIIGLGTGSTAFYFISNLAKKIDLGLNIKCVCSSTSTYNLAKSLNIPLINLNEATNIDIYVDGADEIDSCRTLIKGGGGAFVREKIVASMSNKFIVMADQSKISLKFSSAKLPIEVIPCAQAFVQKQLTTLGYEGSFRKSNNSLFFSDNGNLIFDIKNNSMFYNSKETHEELIHIPGIIDSGFFFLENEILTTNNKLEVFFL